MDLAFSRFGTAASRVEEVPGNFENPLYQEFCKNTTEETAGKMNIKWSLSLIIILS